MTHRWSSALRARRFGLAVAVAALALLAAGCGETPMTAFDPRSEYAVQGLDLFVLIIWMGVIIGVVVEAVLIWAAIRYRRRPGDGLPPQIHGNTIIEVLWTTGPVIVVGYILFVTLPVIFETQAHAPTNSLNVNVI